MSYAINTARVSASPWQVVKDKKKQNFDISASEGDVVSFDLHGTGNDSDVDHTSYVYKDGNSKTSFKFMQHSPGVRHSIDSYFRKYWKGDAHSGRASRATECCT